jgi:hypothetical protein
MSGGPTDFTFSNRLLPVLISIAKVRLASVQTHVPHIMCAALQALRRRIAASLVEPRREHEAPGTLEARPVGRAPISLWIAL